MHELLYVANGCTQTQDIAASLLLHGWRVHRADTVQHAAAFLRKHSRRRLAGLLDLRAHAHGDSVAAVIALSSLPNAGWVAAINADQIQWPQIQALIRDCCVDYVSLPCPSQTLRTVLGHAYGMAQLLPQMPERPLDDAQGEDAMIGRSEAMRTLRHQLHKAAATDAPVFIAGETGTGKELAARALHAHSPRRRFPFVAINCGAIPQTLIQSELFGHERGAFTGAQQRKLGRIEQANHGTLLLDEIGDLPLDSQTALLRFLQEGQIERLGGDGTIRVDVRIVSASHVDLQQAVAVGRFRSDLYHRLCVLQLRQPPLRERGGDIDSIAEHALRTYAAEGKRAIRGFADCARQALHRYPWPGNVRELLNRVRQAVVMSEGRYLTASDLHLEAAIGLSTTLEQARIAAESDAIACALLRNGYRMLETARELDISRATLYRLIERYGLPRRPAHCAAADGIPAAID